MIRKIFPLVRAALVVAAFLGAVALSQAYTIDGVVVTNSDVIIIGNGDYTVTFSDPVGFDGPMVWGNTIHQGRYHAYDGDINNALDYQQNGNSLYAPNSDTQPPNHVNWHASGRGPGWMIDCSGTITNSWNGGDGDIQPSSRITIPIVVIPVPTDTHTTPDDRKEPSDDDCYGMARYSVHSRVVSLNIEDTPLRYTPPRGPQINFTVTYNERDTEQLPTSNLGPKWTFNWLSYVTDDPSQQTGSTTVYVAGGGTETYLFDFSLNAYLPDPQSQAVLHKLDGDTYEKIFPDGSRQVFDKATTSSSYPRRIFMTQWIDPTGQNTVTINYDSSFKVTGITDALGLTTTVEYDQNDPLKISKVVEPQEFLTHRFASFNYSNGQLTTITDEGGIQSTVHYESGNDKIDWLETPYGKTYFARGENGTNRWIEIEDPEGGLERVEYRDDAPTGVSDSDPANQFPLTPNGENSGLSTHNTFFWSKQAAHLFPPQNGVWDYTKAKVTHWLLNYDYSVSAIASNEKRPLENRIWYTYNQQYAPGHVGPSNQPIRISRILEDGQQQDWRYTYNALGNLTSSVDPRPRSTTFVYDSNNIDVTDAYHGADHWAHFEYDPNVPHKIYTATDASGQTTIYNRNSFGQLLNVVNPKQETTTYHYGGTVPDGYLASIDAPDFNGQHSTTTFGYDDARRVNSVTLNPDGYAVTTLYDNLDRPTQITYMDGTTEQFQYQQDFGSGVKVILDQTASKDRLNRWTQRHYNRNRQMDSITDPLGHTTSYGWCSCGSLENITDPAGNVTRFLRDLESRVYQKVFHDSSTINYLYGNQTTPNTAGATSRLKSATDARNQTTNYTYFKDDNVHEVMYPNAQIDTPKVTYSYDTIYNRPADIITEGLGTIHYDYYPVSADNVSTGAGQVKKITGVFDEEIVYSYDKLGRVTGQTVNNGVASSITYDSLGRIASNDNALGHFSRTYKDSPNQLSSRLDTLTYPISTGVTAHYEYFGNTGDRRTQTIQNKKGATNLSQFDYTYLADGTIQTLVKRLPPSSLVNFLFAYDDANRLTSVDSSQPASGAAKHFAYEYDDADNRIYDSVGPPHPSFPSGITNTYTPNELNQIDSILTVTNGSPSEPVILSYDANGNTTSDGQFKTFEWDGANRLAVIHYLDTGKRTEFAYDGLGRRVQIVEYGPGLKAKIQPQGSNYATYTTSPFYVPSAGNYTFSFQGLSQDNQTALIDSVALSGNLFANGSFESPDVSMLEGKFQYQPPNASWSFESDAGIAANESDFTFENPNAPAGTQVAFIQDVGKLSQTVALAPGAYTLAFSAAQRADDQSAQEVQIVVQPASSTPLVRNFIWAGSRIVEEWDANYNVKKRFFPEGEQRIGGTDAGKYYYTRDHLGSIREVTNSTGVVKGRYDYDAFGNILVLVGLIDVDFGYTGHFYHQPSGLNLTMHRAYSPIYGRWLSRDPLNNAELRQGPNLYLYVNNDPLNAVDPLGLDAFVYNTGGLTGHTAFVITDPTGGILIYHKYAQGHMAGSSWSSSLRGIVYDRSIIWSQESPSITQWLADERKAGNNFGLEESFVGSALTDQLVISQLDDLMKNNDDPFSFVEGENCHKFAYDSLINYARIEAAVRRQK